MPLGPEDSANIDRYFTAIKSLNQLDMLEIRNVVAGAINPTVREIFFTLNYHRATLNIDLLLTIMDPRQFQVITMLARSILETAVELKLMATIPDSTKKVGVFMDLEKLKAGRKIVAFKELNPAARTETKVYEEFIAAHERRLRQEKAQIWPNARRLTHWSEMNMENRAKFLGGEFDELYQLHYSQFSWYVHSGVTGVVQIQGDTFASLCGVAFMLIMRCYSLILESIINEFKIYNADDRLKKKITFATMLPFTNGQSEIDALRRALFGFNG